MTRDEAKKALENLFQNDEDIFNETIEELDSYNGYLGDDRYYLMEDLDEFYHDTPASEILLRAYYGRDDDTYTTDGSGNKTYGEFNPNRDYFYYNGYGNLVSSDYKDYSDKLDDYFIDAVIENYYNCTFPDEVESIIEAMEDNEQ